jgi:hypothetical protein
MKIPLGKTEKSAMENLKIRSVKLKNPLGKSE